MILICLVGYLDLYVPKTIQGRSSVLIISIFQKGWSCQSDTDTDGNDSQKSRPAATNLQKEFQTKFEKNIYIWKVRIYKYVWVFIWSVAILYSTDVNWSTNYARYFFGQATNVIRRRMDKIDVLNISPERWCNLSWQHRNFASHFLECQNRQYHH